MIAFSIFWRNIYRYWIFYFIGFIISYCFLYIIWKKKIFNKFPTLQNLLSNDLESLFIILILWVLIWWRLGHVFIYDFQHFFNHPVDIIKVRQWGMSFIWWILWVLISVSVFMYKKNFSWKEFIILLDLLACILPLCIALWRLWNFLNQELYWIPFPTKTFNWSYETLGKLKSTWLLHVYNNVDDVLRINTNFLSIIFEWILLFTSLILIFIKEVWDKKRKKWKISMVFLLRYSIVRFLLEYIRQDSQFEFIWPFTKSQRFFLIFIILWIIWTTFIAHSKKENLEK